MDLEPTEIKAIITRLKRAKSDQLALGTPDRHRSDLAVLVDLPAS